MSEVAPRNSASHPALALGLLFTLLFITGMVMEHKGLGGIDYAYLAGQTLAVWLITKVIIMSLVRGKPPSTQAVGRAIVGGVVFLWVAGVCASSWYENLQVQGALKNLAEASNILETQATATPQPTQLTVSDARLVSSGPSIEQDKVSLARFLNEMANLVRTQQEERRKLEEKIERLELDTLLAPETLIDLDKIAEARITVQQLLELITEEEALLARHWAASEAKLKSIPNEDERNRALKPFYTNKAKLLPLYQRRNDVQREYAQTLLAVLAWSHSHIGKTVLSNGQILFQNQEQLQQYNNYFQRVQVLVEKEAQVIQAIAKAEQDRQNDVNQRLEKAGIR